MHQPLTNVPSTEDYQGRDIPTVALPREPRTNAPLLRGGQVATDAEVTLKVYDLTDKYAEVYSESITVTDTDNPGSDPVWGTAILQGYAMPDGYVFVHWIRAADFTQVGGRTYRIEYSVPTTDFGIFSIIHEHRCLPKISA